MPPGSDLILPAVQGRLNIFQKSMLQWDELHAYNAVHVVRLRGALEADRFAQCVTLILDQRGIAQFNLSHGRFTTEARDLTSCPIQTIPGNGDPQESLVAEIGRQLNLRFDYQQPFCPFRFLIVPAGDSFFFGLVYFHPVADAESIVGLLKDIVAAYARTAAEPPDFPPYLRARGSRLLRHPLVILRKLLAWPGQIRSLRHSFRVTHADPADLGNGFVCSGLAPDELRALLASAKSWGVTANDVFIALLLKSLSPCARSRAKARRRRKLSVGCIVNVRRDLGVARGAFGLVLGSFNVTHEVPDEITLRDLARDVREQTAATKRQRLYLGTPLELGVARLALKCFPPARRRRIYGKHYPLWGGITNLNLNGVWDQIGSDGLLDYFRGVSTGPVTPLVLSVTTLGDRANLGLSYRTTVFSRSDIKELQGRFREHVESMRRAA